jgi:hypothetical protein
MKTTRTWDGVDIITGSIVYFVRSDELGEPVGSHTVHQCSIGLSTSQIRAVEGRIFSCSFRAANFKKYISHKRTTNLRNKIQNNRSNLPSLYRRPWKPDL